MKLTTLRSFTIVLLAGLLTYGCGGSTSSGGGSFSTLLTGSWIGTWKNDGLGPGSPNQGVNNAGLIRAHLTEDPPGTISGTATWTGFSCFLTTTVTGIVSGRSVSLTFVSSDEARVTFVGERFSETNVDGGWDNDTGCLGEGELTLNRE